MPFTATPTHSIERQDIQLDPLLTNLKALLSIDFTAHDERLGKCIKAALRQIEQVAGLLLSPGTVSIQWAELYDYEELPFGPVAGPILVTNLSGQPIDGLSLTGSFPVLRGTFQTGIRLVYSAGYDADTLPDDLAECIIMLAANLFDNGARNWRQIARLHSRFCWAS